MNRKDKRHDRGRSASLATSETKESWRLFCAIEIPESIRSELKSYIDELRTNTNASASWTKADNIHLTLKFFGNVDRKKIEDLSAALARATLGFPRFTVSVGGTGSFPQRGAAKILWIGITDPSQHLTQLHAKVESECEKEGFVEEERAFRPHLTLARLRGLAGARELSERHQKAEFESHQFDATELILFRSELSSTGSRYTVVSSHPLSAT